MKSEKQSADAIRRYKPDTSRGINIHNPYAKDDTALVSSVYDKFRRMPPLLQKSSLIATAAVAEAGLLHVKEEYELVEALLRVGLDMD
jgi:hypothetical protein